MQARHSEERPSRRETLIPALAVAAVGAVAVAAAVMVKRAEAPAAQEASAAPAAAGPTIASVDVVKAPPLKVPSTRSMGGAPACASCGVVQMVVAVRDAGERDARAFQMHIRMDDGSVRTVQQRGALPAGSRVIVDGDTVKPMS
jgi:hypothetical protein